MECSVICMLLAVELLCGWQSFNFCVYSLIPLLTIVLTLVNKKSTVGPAGLSAWPSGCLRANSLQEAEARKA
jgi:hypothetical protein